MILNNVYCVSSESAHKVFSCNLKPEREKKQQLPSSSICNTFLSGRGRIAWEEKIMCIYIVCASWVCVCVCVCVCVLYGPLSTFLAANLQLYHPG